MNKFSLQSLKDLEAEVIYILREAYSQFKSASILFPCIKNSIVLTHIAKKAFYPLPIPFTFLQIESDCIPHDIQVFRDQLLGKLRVRTATEDVIFHRSVDLKKKSIEDLSAEIYLSIGQRHDFDAFIFCASAGNIDPVNKIFFSLFENQFQKGLQRPHYDFWKSLQFKKSPDRPHCIFPLSNWLELDFWIYIYMEGISLPSIYFAHDREVINRNGYLHAVTPSTELRNSEKIETRRVRFTSNWVDDPLTESGAENVESIIFELYSNQFRNYFVSIR